MMATAIPIQLVCFDLGGVLIRIRTDWRDWLEVAEVNTNQIAAFEKHREAIQRIWVEHECGQMTEDEFLRRASIVFGVGGLTASEMRRVHQAVLVEVYPGGRELLEDICAHGVQVALLSNTCEDHWRELAEMLPVKLVDTIVTSFSLGVRKPDRAAYAAVEQSSGVFGEAIVFFDDRVENIVGARSVGWRAMLIEPSCDPVGLMREALRQSGVLDSN